MKKARKFAWASIYVVFKALTPIGPLKIGLDVWLVANILFYGSMGLTLHERLAAYGNIS